MGNRRFSFRGDSVTIFLGIQGPADGLLIRGVFLGPLECCVKLGVDLNLLATVQTQVGWTMDTGKSADYKTAAAKAAWFLLVCLFVDLVGGGPFVRLRERMFRASSHRLRNT